MNAPNHAAGATRLLVAARGIVAWAGASEIDGKPLVVIVNGYKSTGDQLNEKLGHMLQAWILRADLDPHSAVQFGEDFSICPIEGGYHRG